MPNDLVLYAGQPPRERYQVGGRMGVGVSTVLRETGARPPLRGSLEAIRTKAFAGQLVHALAASWWAEPSPRLTYPERVARESKSRGVEWNPLTVEKAAPYWDSFVRLIGMIRLRMRLWEYQVIVNDLPLVCGTLDGWGDIGRRLATIDLKTRPLALPGDSYQTMAYLEGLRRQNPGMPPTARCIVELRRGDPHLHWLTDDGPAFASWQRLLERWTDQRATAPMTRTGHLNPEQEKQLDDYEPWQSDPDVLG